MAKPLRLAGRVTVKDVEKVRFMQRTLRLTENLLANKVKIPEILKVQYEAKRLLREYNIEGY